MRLNGPLGPTLTYQEKWPPIFVKTADFAAESLFGKAASFAHASGRYREARELAERTFNIRKERFGELPQHSATLGQVSAVLARTSQTIRPNTGSL